MAYRQKRTKKQKLLYALKQTGKRKSIKQDRKVKALRSGRRISKTGKKYTETRRNRSDLKGKRI